MEQPAGGAKAINNPPAIGVYIHFPFCQRKCRYCDFYSENTSLERRVQWLKALRKEIALRCQTSSQLPKISTIYIGGGSPNLLQPEQLATIVQALQNYFDWHTLSEFTMELNPNRITPALTTQMKAGGVNRVSLGFQSLQPTELQVLGRLHTAIDCIQAYTMLQSQGFSNISIDLIYGIPGQALTSWQDTIHRVLELKPQHLSLYNLTFEEGTQLTEALNRGEVEVLDEELEWQMYAWAAATLADFGFEHYEISNWARPGYQSCHNQSYWNRYPYLGFGPSAHSFLNEQRFWNVKSIDQYIYMLSRGRLPTEATERISAEKRHLEMLMLTLRTKRGIALRDLEYICRCNSSQIIAQLANRLGAQLEDLIAIEAERLRLTTRGWFLYNALLKIFLSLIKEEDDDH